MKLMKNKYIPFLISLVILSSSYVISQESQISLKVMTYNIWNGFDWGNDTIRKKDWIRWIQRKKPDVLALQELCDATGHYVANHICSIDALYQQAVFQLLSG